MSGYSPSALCLACVGCATGSLALGWGRVPKGGVAHPGLGAGQHVLGTRLRVLLQLTFEMAAMGRSSWRLVFAAGAGLALALEALPWLTRWLLAGRRPRREVLFFPSQVTCTEALLQAPGLPPGPSGCPCSLPHSESSLSRLLRALLAARSSLELCLFAFSSPQLGRAVQLLHQRGVRVRVITDCDYMALNGSQIGLLRKAGKPPHSGRGAEDLFDAPVDFVQSRELFGEKVEAGRQAEMSRPRSQGS